MPNNLRVLLLIGVRLPIDEMVAFFFVATYDLQLKTANHLMAILDDLNGMLHECNSPEILQQHSSCYEN